MEQISLRKLTSSYHGVPTSWRIRRCLSDTRIISDDSSCSVYYKYDSTPVAQGQLLTRLQEDDPDILLITSSFLLADARSSEQTFELLNGEGSFPRLVDLIVSPELDEAEELRRLIMQLLYEMSRIQKISVHDLGTMIRTRSKESWLIRPQRM